MSLSETLYQLLIPQLNLPSMSLQSPYVVQITISVLPPPGDPAIIVPIHRHRSLYHLVELGTITNFENSRARHRERARTSYGHCAIFVRRS